MENLPLEKITYVLSNPWFLLQPLRLFGIWRLLFRYMIDSKFEEIAVCRFNVILPKESAESKYIVILEKPFRISIYYYAYYNTIGNH